MEVSRSHGRILLLRKLQRLFGRWCHHKASVWQIVCWDSLPPPELTRDAPIVRCLHPVPVGIAVLFRYKFYPPALNAFQCYLREVIHLEEPLL